MVLKGIHYFNYILAIPTQLEDTLVPIHRVFNSGRNRAAAAYRTELVCHTHVDRDARLSVVSWPQNIHGFGPIASRQTTLLYNCTLFARLYPNSALYSSILQC